MEQNLLAMMFFTTDSVLANHRQLQRGAGARFHHEIPARQRANPKSWVLQHPLAKLGLVAGAGDGASENYPYHRASSRPYQPCPSSTSTNFFQAPSS